MYIVIFEDSSLGLAAKVTQDDLDMADQGYLTIVDISNHELPTIYDGGEWQPVRVL